MMKICVFCSAKDVAPVYMDAAATFGALLAKGGHTLVWGGSNVGVMGVLANAVKGAGGEMVGVSIDRFKHLDHEEADEMYVVVDLPARLRKFIEISDAFVALPGGAGTLDEITHIIEWRKYGKKKPVALLSMNGFYDGLKMQFERMEKEGFLFEPLEQIVRVAAKPEEALAYIASAAPVLNP